MVEAVIGRLVCGNTRAGTLEPAPPRVRKPPRQNCPDRRCNARRQIQFTES